MTPLELEGQLGVIDTQGSENGGVQVVNVHRVTHDVVTEIIRFAECKAALSASAGQPDGEAPRVMIAAVVVRREFALGVDGPAEFAAHTTNVSFSSPRSRRSVISAAEAWSVSLAWPRICFGRLVC